MKSPKPYLATLMLLAIATLAGCSNTSTKSDVSDNIRKSLLGRLSFSVSQDREKGVVTLSGNVASNADKSQAETIANGLAAGQVVSDQIAVVPPNDGRDGESREFRSGQGDRRLRDAAYSEQTPKSGQLRRQEWRGDVNGRGQLCIQALRRKSWRPPFPMCSKS